MEEHFLYFQVAWVAAILLPLVTFLTVYCVRCFRPKTATLNHPDASLGAEEHVPLLTNNDDSDSDEQAAHELNREESDIHGRKDWEPFELKVQSQSSDKQQLQISKSDSGASSTGVQQLEQDVYNSTITYCSDSDLPDQWTNEQKVITNDEPPIIMLTSRLSENLKTIRIDSESTDDYQSESISQPSKPRATSITHDSVQLEWTKPKQGAHNISYTILYRSADDPPDQWIKWKAKTDEERVTVSQLSEKTVYYFKVQPESADGQTGLQSEVSEPVTTKVIVPSKPGKPRATNVTHNSIQLQWTKPEQGAHNISYTVLYRSTDDPQWTEWTAKTYEERVTVSQLSEKTVYYFKVQPESADGQTGLQSEVSEPITTKVIVPSKPGKPRATNVTLNSIQLQWTKPEQGAHNISYTVLYRSTDDPQWTEWTAKTYEERVTVSQLSEKTVYYFKVQPESADGQTGLQSEVSEPVTTKVIVPSKPGKPRATNVTHNSIQLQWTKPEQGAHNISYTVLYRSTDDPQWTEWTAKTYEEGVTVSQLSEKTVYYFKVQPESADGQTGLESEVSEPVTTKVIVPSKPGKPRATNVTLNSIQLQWTKPEQGAHNISYTVLYRSTDDPQWTEWTAKTYEERVTVSQLSEKTVYYFKVQPESADGQTGLQSEVSEPITTKVIVPSKPGKPRATNVTHNSIQLQWTKPEQGAHNISYTVLYRSTDDPQWTEWTAKTYEERVTVSQLSEKTAYYFKVRPECYGRIGNESVVSESIKTIQKLNLRNALNEVVTAQEKWYFIGLQLGLEQHDLDTIKHENNDTTDCLVQMLSKWLRQGRGVTWKKLIDSLNHATVGFHNLADSIEADHNICEVASNKDVMPTSAIQSREGFKCPLCGKCSIEQHLDRKCPKFNSSFPYLETKHLTENEELYLYNKLIDETQSISKEFISLLHHMRKSLKKQKINVFEMATYIKDIASLQSLSRPLSHSLQVKTFISASEIIDHLKDQRYISFFNYHIMQELITEYGTVEDKAMLSAYEENFTEFCKRSVFEIPKEVFGRPPNGGEMLAFKVTNDIKDSLPSSGIPPKRDTLSPRSQTLKKSSQTLDLSMDDTLIIQKNIARALGVNVGCLVFLGVSMGCIELKFSAPRVIMDKIRPQLNVDTAMESTGFADLESSGIYILCGPPGKPCATNVTCSSISLKWTKPEYQGFHPIQHYSVHYQSVTPNPPDEWQVLRTEGCEDNVKVNNLQSKASFIFKVQAVTEVGSGIISDESDLIQLSRIESKDQNRIKPGKPEFTNITHNSIQLEWTEPEVGASDITSYTVLYRSANQPPDQWMEQRTEKTEKSMVISQLSEKTLYHFKIRPESENSLWLESEASEPIMTRMIIPSKPGKPRATKVTCDNIELEWTKPEQGAHNITWYIISGTSDIPNQRIQQKTAQERIMISNLPERTAFYFKILPQYGEDGFGLESDISEPIITQGALISDSDRGKYVLMGIHMYFKM